MAKISERTIWKDTEMLECVSIIPEMENTASFTFKAPSGALFDFDPGQFMTLEIPVPGGPLHRTYTISSSPSRPRNVTITAKAQADSIGTRWMLDNLRPGSRIKAIGPAQPVYQCKQFSKEIPLYFCGLRHHPDDVDDHQYVG